MVKRKKKEAQRTQKRGESKNEEQRENGEKNEGMKAV